jgi:hypothetical protein
MNEPVDPVPLHKGRYQSGQLGQTVNLLADAFVGSNPALPTGYLMIECLFDWKVNFLQKSESQQVINSVNKKAGIAQLVEHNPSKVRVARSSRVSRS